MNWITEYLFRFSDLQAVPYGLDTHLQITWWGMLFWLIIIALLVNRAIPNLKRVHLILSKEKIGVLEEEKEAKS